MAVVGWWSGYKLGGVVALTLQFFQNFAFTTIGTPLVLGAIIITCNIELMFVNEKLQTDRVTSKEN